MEGGLYDRRSHSITGMILLFSNKSKAGVCGNLTAGRHNQKTRRFYESLISQIVISKKSGRTGETRVRI